MINTQLGKTGLTVSRLGFGCTALGNQSVTHMGTLTDQGPPPCHPAPVSVKQIGQDVAAFCRRQGTPIAHLAIQFALQNDAVDVTLFPGHQVGGNHTNHKHGEKINENHECYGQRYSFPDITFAGWQ